MFRNILNILRHQQALSVLLTVVITGLLPLSAKAQGYAPIIRVDSADRIVVSLLTCAPGAEIYELEGHSGLRVRTPRQDLTANWGLFDFNSPNFVYRFCKGETDYMAGIISTALFVSEYAAQGRCVTEQVLNLTDSQARRVVDLVNDNLHPSKRSYRYNYVLDNCATRPVRLVEQAIGATIEFPDSGRVKQQELSSFRRVMQAFHRDYPWYQFGIDLALGSGIDREITVREAMFAPALLEELASSAKIFENGRSVPLVLRTERLTPGNPAGIAAGPTPWYLTPMAAASLLLLITLVLTWIDWRRRRLSRWFDCLLFGIYGLLGCLIAFLVFISTHEATSPNVLLLWLNPLCLFAAIAVWIKRWRPVLDIYFMLNILAVTVCMVLWAMGFQYANLAFWPMILSSLTRSVAYLTLPSNDKLKG